jgi:hypothetical protein
MIFVSPAAGPVGVTVAALFCLGLRAGFWTPPTGASVARRPGRERRLPRPRRVEERVVLRMSSSDEFSLSVPDMLEGEELVGGEGRSYGQHDLVVAEAGR